jgi:L,D-transpeptidase YcbB
MRAGSAGLVAGLICLLCFAGLPSRAAEDDSADDIVSAQSDLPPPIQDVEQAQPLLMAAIGEEAVTPAFVEPVEALASEGDTMVARLPESAAPPETRENIIDLTEKNPQLPAAESQTEHPAAETIRPPVSSFKDLIKAAVEKLRATQAKGAHAAEWNKAIAAFYESHDFAPLWVADGKANAAARAAMARIARAGEDGLDLRGAAAPVFESGDEKLADAEVTLSAQVVAYGRQASGSRIDPQQISALIGAKPELADPAAILTNVAAAGDKADAVLADFNPPQKAYRALRDKLAELRRVALPTARVTIPAGPPLKVGIRDPRVSLVRARFGLDANTGPEDLVYDTQVAAAVADFQRANGLPASGVLGMRTLAALAGMSGGDTAHVENEIIANMERWRWLPRDIGTSRVEVNIPEFMVRVTLDGEVAARNRVVVGKTQTPTPVFSNTMRFLIVNPYWNVPQSIIRKEMLPRMGEDSSYLSRLGYEVSSRHGQLIVRQPPGERNALGRIKFMFPNDYSVYLHDTPSRGLFGSARRAFSHGCVRVDQPFALAEAVLGRDNGWTAERVKRMIGGHERYVYLPKLLPIHIEYFTAFVDDTGELQLREDIYGYSARVKTALGLSN